MPVTAAARSPAPDASRSAMSGLGSRMAEITRQTGQTQHSGEPVAKPSRVPGRTPGTSHPAQPAGGQREGGDGRRDQALGLVPHRVAGHAGASVSTRFLSAVSAVSMIAFSALRLNMPSIAIASSTESV